MNPLDQLKAISLIVTHDGPFHADEILSIALLRCLDCKAPLLRTFTVTEQQFDDPTVLVLDIGQRLEPDLGNFDHHQNRHLTATNLMMLNRFASHVYSDYVISQLRDRLFNRVSDVDRGEIVLEEDSFVLEFNSIIRHFNGSYDGFNRALRVATKILAALMFTALKSENDSLRWQLLDKANGVAYQHDGEIITTWKTLAKQEGIYLLVCPNPRGGYSVISRDSKELTIPPLPNSPHQPDVELQTFLHASGFMAAYVNLGEAARHAEQIVNNHLATQPHAPSK